MDLPSIRPTRIGRTGHPFAFSVCTLVTKKDEYARMLASFDAAGFGGPDVEYLYVDNSAGNELDAYQAFNLFLQRAQGRFVIVCHQDVELIDRRADLERAIAEVDGLDARWALLGNAGGIDLEHRSTWITDDEPGRFHRHGRRFPQRVHTLDENFILVRNDANLAVSVDLEGFHFYGTDLCLVAETLGYGAYVIAFHVYHHSSGTLDERFFRSRDELVRKYRRAFRARYLRTTLVRLYLSGSALGSALFGSALARRIVRWYLKLKMRLLDRA